MFLTLNENERKEDFDDARNLTHYQSENKNKCKKNTFVLKK